MLNSTTRRFMLISWFEVHVGVCVVITRPHFSLCFSCCCVVRQAGAHRVTGGSSQRRTVMRGPKQGLRAMAVKWQWKGVSGKRACSCFLFVFVFLLCARIFGTRPRASVVTTHVSIHARTHAHIVLVVRFCEHRQSVCQYLLSRTIKRKVSTRWVQEAVLRQELLEPVTLASEENPVQTTNKL